jgi:phage baseplate assembly protein W
MQTQKESTLYQERAYKDLDLSFKKNIISSDVSKKLGENAIKQSLKTLVLTRNGDRLFRPEVGSNVYSYLFEPIMPETTISIQKAIEDIINKYEPRVLVSDVEVLPEIDYNRYTINITFSMVNDPKPLEIDFFLERLG